MTTRHHHSILIAACLMGADTAVAQPQVEMRNPSDAFVAAYTAGELAKALPLIEPDVKACIAEGGGMAAANEKLWPCTLLMAYYGSALAVGGRSIEAVGVSRRAVELAADFGTDSEMSLVANFFLGLTLERQGRNAEAEEPFRIALEGAEKLLADDPALAAYVARRGNNLIMIGRIGEGLALAERAIAIAGDTVEGNFFRLTQANALIALGRLSEAEATLRTGVSRLTVLSGAASPEVTALQQSLALCLEKSNRTDEAIALWRRTLAARRAQGDGPDVSDSLTGLGVALIRAGDLREAETVLREALTIRLRFYGETSNLTGLAYSNLGLVLLETGQPDEAANMFVRAVNVLNASGGANPEELVTVMTNLATALMRTGMTEASAAMQRQALDIAVTSFGEGNVRTGLLRNNLAAALLRLKQFDAAIALLKTNYDAMQKLGAEGVQLRALSAANLGGALAEKGDAAAARIWLARADSDSRAAYRADHGQRINAAWLFGQFLLKQRQELPLARTLLRDAGGQVLARAGGSRDFDARAREELNGFTIVFRDQVRAAWRLGNPDG